MLAASAIAESPPVMRSSVLARMVPAVASSGSCLSSGQKERCWKLKSQTLPRTGSSAAEANGFSPPGTGGSSLAPRIHGTQKTDFQARQEKTLSWPAFAPPFAKILPSSGTAQASGRLFVEADQYSDSTRILRASPSSMDSAQKAS